MHILVIILLVVVSLIALVLIVGLFSQKEYSVQREIIIHKPLDEVFSYLRLLKNQDNFNEWTMKDPNMKRAFKGTDGTVGFIYAWDGNKNAGAGEQEILHITEGERLDIEIRFTRPFTVKSHTPFTTTAITADQTKVTWGIRSKMPYPMNVMLLLINTDKAFGKSLEKSLGMLKGILEAKS